MLPKTVTSRIHLNPSLPHKHGKLMIKFVKEATLTDTDKRNA